LFLKPIKFSVLFLVFLFFSCSGEPPQLLESWWQLNLIDDTATGDTVQALSFFLHAEDEDGEDDMDQIYLIHDDLQLLWSIPLEKWSAFTDQGVKWIGFNRLLAPGDGVFPEGNYRVLLIDIGGERDESSFYLRNNIPEKDEIILPEMSYDNNNFSIMSEFPKFQLWFYDGEGQLIEKSKDFLMGNYQWNDFVRNINRRASSFTVYTEPETGSWGLISGPHLFSGS
jgi:hypothetical protein